MSKKESWDETKLASTRIAIYDDLLSAPRIVDVNPCELNLYIEKIASSTYTLAKEAGGNIPYTIIREVCENFIHAYFKEPCISILDSGNTIRFTDQGPGIKDKERAQLPGFTSASSDMRKYIRGVGSGLPTVREYLRFSNGRLVIEDNIRKGTVITISVDTSYPYSSPVVFKEQTEKHAFTNTEATKLQKRDIDILKLALKEGNIGPTLIKETFGMSVSTAYRILAKLEDEGFLNAANKRKRKITTKGIQALNDRGIS